MIETFLPPVTSTSSFSIEISGALFVIEILMLILEDLSSSSVTMRVSVHFSLIVVQFWISLSLNLRETLQFWVLSSDQEATDSDQMKSWLPSTETFLPPVISTSSLWTVTSGALFVKLSVIFIVEDSHSSSVIVMVRVHDSLITLQDSISFQFNFMDVLQFWVLSSDQEAIDSSQIINWFHFIDTSFPHDTSISCLFTLISGALFLELSFTLAFLLLPAASVTFINKLPFSLIVVQEDMFFQLREIDTVQFALSLSFRDATNTSPIKSWFPDMRSCFHHVISTSDSFILIFGAVTSKSSSSSLHAPSSDVAVHRVIIGINLPAGAAIFIVCMAGVIIEVGAQIHQLADVAIDIALNTFPIVCLDFSVIFLVIWENDFLLCSREWDCS